MSNEFNVTGNINEISDCYMKGAYEGPWLKGGLIHY